jgi:LysM repeat protein
VVPIPTLSNKTSLTANVISARIFPVVKTINQMKTEQFNEEENEINPIDGFLNKLKGKFMNNDNEEFKPLSLNKAFWVVGALHAIAIGGIVLFSAQSKAKAQQAVDDKKFLDSAPMVGVDNPEPAKVASKPVVVDKKNVVAPATAKPKVITKIPSNPNPNYPQLSKEYVVKQGDTFHKIVKRFGLNATRLKLINGIKDENKISVGQKLKFM